jgi:hypothetical protein
MQQRGFDLAIAPRLAQRPADAAREPLGFDVSPCPGERRGHGRHPVVWGACGATRFLRAPVVWATAPGEAGQDKRSTTLAHDRFGVRWGLAGGTTLATVEEARAAARLAEASGFDGLWISHGMAVDPIVALACVGAEAPTLKEFGTSVVPLYGRHPIGLAQLAMTA